MTNSSVISLLLLLLWGCTPNPDAVPSEAEAELLFVHEVQPLLKTKCFACHGDDPEEIEGDFEIRSLGGMLAGGESGEAALVPGDPHQSRIYIAATWQDEDLEMPPKENDRLSNTQLDLLRAWIAGGAPWPGEERRAYLLETSEWNYADGIQVETSGALSEEWANRRYKPEDLWAFYPVKFPDIPWEALHSDQLRHPIDAFVQHRLDEVRFEPAPRVDKLTLIRRATFDLTGLPPTPHEIQAFLDDDSPSAFHRVIDRLLASPRYGERWARHWLDVTRYADTDGFSNDYERPNAWRYRDYVIRSFNADKPYDQFVREQIAGDEHDTDDPEALIATGYLRMGPWEHTAMSVAAETRQFYLDDVTNNVGETFLSIPLRCASCHDHKFDPIPTKDYYRVQAAFAPVQFADRHVPFLSSENLDGFEEGQAELEKRIEWARAEQKAVNDKEEAAARAWMEERGLTYLPKRERRRLPDDQQPPRYHGLDFQDLGYRKVMNKRIQLLNRERDRYEPLALSVYNSPLVENPRSGRRMEIPEERDGDPQPTFILTGGSVYAASDSVSPGVLSAVQTLTEPADSDNLPFDMEGRRLALAEWITDPDNPISTRSIVNRIWGYHFGKGIARNPNNFGVMGHKPTHPELLDWLTSYFVRNAWSMKALHRLIMTSETYQRATHHSEIETLREQDPNNETLAYFEPRRLSAEELRDAMLFVSGELNLEMGGLPVKPEINREVALQPRHVMGSIAPPYQPSRTPDERNRRTIYAYRYRGLPDPMLEVFNQPSADLSCERRTASTVTPQVFTLFNSQNSHDRALGMAYRLTQDARALEDQIARAVFLAWNRPATLKEIEKGRAFVEKMVTYHHENPAIAQPYPTEVRRKMFEEMTGEPFEYTEPLDVYQDYVADLKPWDVDPEMRALADFCLVLFNANEFVYVY